MKPSAFGQANKADPLPFSAPDKDKTASTHTTKFTDIPVEFVLCLRFFVAIFAQQLRKSISKISTSAWRCA